MTLEATINWLSLMLKKISSFKMKRQSAKAVWDLIDWLRRRKYLKRLFALAVAKIGKRLEKRNIRIIESACPRKDEDAKHIATLRWTLEHLEKIEQGHLTLEEFERI